MPAIEGIRVGETMNRIETRRPLLEEYLIRLELALATFGTRPVREVVTSKDTRLKSCEGLLERLASDVRRWTAPFHGDETLQANVLIAGPGADIGPMTHMDGDAVRFVLTGSLTHQGAELTPGDWLFAPAGTTYRVRAGHRGLISLTTIFRPMAALEQLGSAEVIPIRAGIG